MRQTDPVRQVHFHFVRRVPARCRSGFAGFAGDFLHLIEPEQACGELQQVRFLCVPLRIEHPQVHGDLQRAEGQRDTVGATARRGRNVHQIHPQRIAFIGRFNHLPHPAAQVLTHRQRVCRGSQAADDSKKVFRGRIGFQFGPQRLASQQLVIGDA